MFTTEKNGRLESLKLHADGKNVSSLLIVDTEARIGESTVSVGGIAAVRTDDEYRNQGYARRLLNESIRIMAERGFDISILFGIADFYHKFGYATVYPEYLVNIPLKYANDAKGYYEVRAYDPKDRDTLAGLYNLCQPRYVGSAVRGANWAGFRGAMDGGGGVRSGADRDWRFMDAKGIVAADGSELAGYAFYEESVKGLYVTEAFSRDSAGYSTLLSYFAGTASMLGADAINVYMPPDHPFARHCRLYGYEASAFYPHGAEGMARIININTFFEKLLPAFRARLKANVYMGEKSVAFDTDIGSVTLHVEDEAISVAPGCAAGAFVMRTGQDRLCALAMGYIGANDFLLGCCGAHCSEPLVNILFPSGHSYMWIPDRF